MRGKVYREWIFFLKERKLYSKFIIHYRAASISCRTWGREKLSFKLLNGGDYILPDKDDSISFSRLTTSMQIMDWNLPSDVKSNWVSLVREFGELKGYVEKIEPSNLYSIYYNDAASTSTSYRARKVNKQQRETFGKWYDRFNGVNMKNRYRR